MSYLKPTLEIGSLYKTTGSSPTRPKAVGAKPDVPSDTTKMQANNKKTGSLAGQPKAMQSKKMLPATSNPDGKDFRK